MHQKRKHQLLMFAVVLVMIAAAVGLRQLPETADWAPLFDIAALLGFVGLSFSWERTVAPSRSS